MRAAAGRGRENERGGVGRGHRRAHGNTNRRTRPGGSPGPARGRRGEGGRPSRGAPHVHDPTPRRSRGGRGSRPLHPRHDLPTSRGNLASAHGHRGVPRAGAGAGTPGAKEEGEGESRGPPLGRTRAEGEARTPFSAPLATVASPPLLSRSPRTPAGARRRRPRHLADGTASPPPEARPTANPTLPAPGRPDRPLRRRTPRQTPRPWNPGTPPLPDTAASTN